MGGAAPRWRTVCQLTHVCNVKTESRGVRRSEEEEMGGRERGEDVGDSKGGGWGGVVVGCGYIGGHCKIAVPLFDYWWRKHKIHRIGGCTEVRHAADKEL